mmetsp:Transcript_26302/g.40356  ORF Transcript_26302/g.40356 Transcript_26302/m.40356 type:complete len:98 (+) Transcript_26302:693-986(+)
MDIVERVEIQFSGTMFNVIGNFDRKLIKCASICRGSFQKEPQHFCTAATRECDHNVDSLRTNSSKYQITKKVMLGDYLYDTTIYGLLFNVVGHDIFT